MNGLWWWIDRWRKSTAYTDMTLEEQGAYRNLLDEATLRGGGLPNDERVLAKACGDALCWKRVKAVVLARFVLVDGLWRNETLDAVLKEAERRVEKQKNYRERKRNDRGNEQGSPPGNAVGNAGGNASGNTVGNASGNEHGNEHGNNAGNAGAFKAGNKRGYPDPDPDPDLTYVQPPSSGCTEKPVNKITAAGAPASRLVRKSA